MTKLLTISAIKERVPAPLYVAEKELLPEEKQALDLIAEIFVDQVISKHNETSAVVHPH